MITFIEFFYLIRNTSNTEEKIMNLLFILVKTIKSLCNLSIITAATYMYM
jgi:hypothetical protein